MPPERPRGRSSILKPPKVRNPLSDLDKKQNVDDDGTTFDRNKRVSFSNTQGIALFRHTVHGNTIWDNFFEEPHKPDNSENSDIGSSLIRKMEASTNLLKASCSTQNTMDDLDEIKKQILSGDNNSYDNIDISFTPASEHDMTFATHNESGSINDDDDCCVNMGYHKPSTKRISDIVLELTNPSLVDQTEALINYKINDNNTLSGTNKFDKNMDLSFKDNMDKLISSIENENVKKVHTEMNENDPLTTDDSEMSITQGIAMPIEETISSVVKPKQILMHSFVYSNVMEKKQNWIEDKENILIPVAVIDRLETESDCKSRLSIPHNQSVNNEEAFINDLRNSNKMCNDMQNENQIIESKKGNSIALINGVTNCPDKENQDENIVSKRENVGCDLTTDSRILQHDSNKQKIVFDQNVDYDMFLIDVDGKKDGNRFFNSTAYPTFKNNETLNTINDQNCLMDLNESKLVNIINAKSVHSLVSESNTTSLINVANLKKQIGIESNYNYDNNGSALTDAPQSKIVGKQEEIPNVFNQTKNEEENPKIINSKQIMIVEDKYSDGNIPFFSHSINKNIEEQATGQKMDYDEIQVIEAVEINKKSDKRKTIIFDQADSNCNMSITLATPLTLENKENLHNIIADDIKQRETVVFDQCASECKTSMTSIKNNDKEVKEQTFTSSGKNTIYYPDDSNCNMSMTLPILNDERKKSFVAQNSTKDKSFTNDFLPRTEIHKKRQTIVFDQQSPDGEMSITCGVPSNNNLFNKDDPFADIRREKRKTIIFNPEDTNCNMSMTMAVPSNYKNDEYEPSRQRRETIVFDRQNSNCEMSMTCMVPSAKLLSNSLNENTRPNIIIDKQTDFTFLKAEFNKKRTTVVFDQNNKESDMSMTSVMASNRDREETSGKSIIYDQGNPNCNTSVIVPLTMNISNENGIDDVPSDSNENGDLRSPNKKVDEKNHTVNIDQSGKICEKSMTLIVPIHCGIEEKNCLLKRQSVIFDQHNPDCEMSITSTVPSNKEKYNMTLEDLITDIRSEKRKTIIYNPEDSNCNMSMTSAIPTNFKNDEFKETVTINEPLNSNGEMSITSIVSSADIKREKRKTIIFNPEDTKCNMSMTVAVASNCKNDEYKAVTINEPLNDIDMHSSNDLSLDPKLQQKRETVLFDQQKSICEMPSIIPPVKFLNENGELNIINGNNVLDQNKMSMICATSSNKDVEEMDSRDILDKEKSETFNQVDPSCNASVIVPSCVNISNDNVNHISFLDNDSTERNENKRQTGNFDEIGKICDILTTQNTNENKSPNTSIERENCKLKEQSNASLQSIAMVTNNTFIAANVLNDISQTAESTLKRPSVLFNQITPDCGISTTSEMKTESEQHFIARSDEIDFEPIVDRIDNKENISKTIVFDQDKRDRSDTSISLTLENNVQKSELPVNNSISLNLRANQTKETLLLDRQYCEMSMTSIIPHVNDRSIIKPFFGGKSNMSAVKSNITDYNLEDNCNMSISMQTPWKYKKDDSMTIDDYMQDVEMPTVSDLSSKFDIEQLKESSVLDPENPNGETSISSITSPVETIESKHDDVDILALKEVASDIIEEKRQSVIYDQDNLDHNMSIDMCSLTKFNDDAKNITSNDVKMNCLSPNLSIQSEAGHHSSSICDVKEPVLDNELLAKDCEDKEIANHSAQLIISTNLNEKEDDENHENDDILLKNSSVLINEKKLRRSTVEFDQDSPNYKTSADSGYENSSNAVISSDINESNSSSISDKRIDRISNESTHNIVEVIQLSSTLQENISSIDVYVNDECSKNKLKDSVDEQPSIMKLNERRISIVESQKSTEIQPIVDIQDVDLIANEVKINEELSLQDNSISSSNLLEESIAIVVDDMNDHRNNSYLGSPSKIILINDALKNGNDKSISGHDLSLNASNSSFMRCVKDTSPPIISKYAAESDNLNDDQPMEIEMSDNHVDVDTINNQNSFINNSKSDMATENIESRCHTEDNCESSIYNKKCDKSELQNSKEEIQISGFKEINMSDAVKETVLDDKTNETIATNTSLNAQTVDTELNTIQLINLKTFTRFDGSITNKLNESIPNNPIDNNDGLGSQFNRNESLKENNISTNSNGQLNTSDKRKYSESDLGDDGDDNVSIKKPKLSFSVCQWIKDISKNVNESSNQSNISQNIDDNRHTSTEQIYADRSPKSGEEISKMLENISDMSLVESSMDNIKESNNSDSQNIIQNTSESDSNTAISNPIMNNHDQNEFDVSIAKNEDEKKTQLNDLIDSIKSANVCDCIPEEFSENEWRFLFLNGTMRLKIKFQNCDNTCATKMPISNINLERLVARDPVSEEYYMCIAVINQIKSRNLIALCSNLGDVENLLMHCSTICSEAKRWNRMLEILYLMYGLEANNDNKFIFRIASGRLRCIWQVEVKMNCLPYADKKDIEMHVVAGKSPIKNREFLNVIENIDLNWSFLRNLTDDLHKLVRTFETD